MAGLPGKQGWWAGGKQSAKGTAATAAKHMWSYTDGAISPTRDNDQLQETDDSRDVGASYIKQTGVSGNPATYVRDNSVDWLIAAAFGAVADSGTTNFVHAITPSTALPYLTFWRGIGNTLYEQFKDCFVSDFTVKTAAGEPLTIQHTIMGLTPSRLASDPSPSWTGPPVVAMENGQVYTYNDATVTLSGSTTALVSSFELTYTNNVVIQQTNAAVPYDLQAGTRQLDLSFDLIFETLNEYNAFHYGSTSGTTESSSLYTTAADFTFAHGANNSVDFSLPIIAYEEFPVQANADGSPVTVSVRATAQRPAPGANLATVTVKNQKATTF